MLAAAAVTRVCVIGGGAAGLSALYHLRQAGLEVTLLERNSFVGGLWKQTSDNAIYDSLVTNLPKEIMEFSTEHPFPPSARSFLHHSEMWHYLATFAETNQLPQQIKLNSDVINVSKISGDEGQSKGWEVRYEDTVLNSKHIIRCDAVVVCNGHFNVPSIPTMTGQQLFKGEIIHSKQYKNPNFCKDKSVLVVGVKSSGTDIARELIGVAHAVHISDRNYKDQCPLSDDSIVFHSSISHCDEEGRIIISSGEALEIDTIIWCTGYDYDFPFLREIMNGDVTSIDCERSVPCGASDINIQSSDASSGSVCLNISDRSVRPLHKHVFFIPDPTLSFIGIPHTIIPFPIFYLQSAWVASVYGSLPGAAPLPSASEMNTERILTEAALRESSLGGSYPRNYHYMGQKQFEYMRSLAGQIGLLSTPEKLREFNVWLQTVNEVYDEVGRSRPKTVGGNDVYRKNVYEISRYYYIAIMRIIIRPLISFVCGRCM